MQAEERDAAYLWDLLEAANDAVDIARDMSFDAMLADRKTQLALSKAVELVGEAASRLSPEFRQQVALEWHAIIGMRNRLVHDYRRIDFRILWDVVTNELPDLITVLEPHVPDLPA